MRRKEIPARSRAETASRQLGQVLVVKSSGSPPEAAGSAPRSSVSGPVWVSREAPMS